MRVGVGGLRGGEQLLALLKRCLEPGDTLLLLLLLHLALQPHPIHSVLERRALALPAHPLLLTARELLGAARHLVTVGLGSG